MAQDYRVTLPKLGESIVSATVIRWFKREGESVKLDEPLLEVSTDKVNSEIPSPTSGVLAKIVAAEGQELEVGELLALIEGGGVATSVSAVEVRSCAPCSQDSSMKDSFSPGLLRLAKENGLSLEELAAVPATGAGGRLSKRDLEVYLEKRGSASGDGIERVKMSHMRKAIAENMVRSFYEAPHASLITEVDVTRIMDKIGREKEAFLQKSGAKLTITAFMAKALTRAVRDYPLINASLEGDTIAMKKFVNLGIAVSVDHGIMVPVIRGCEGLSLEEIARQLQGLSGRAREGKLTAEETREGSITLTNFGISGVQIGIPIIRHPEVAIVGMGSVHKKVVPLDSGELAVRSVCFVSLTFDHRVLDGMYGCGFLKAVKHQLESEEL